MHAEPRGHCAIRSSLQLYCGVVIVRPAGERDVDAAVEIWRHANGVDAAPGHASRLIEWADQPGAVLFLADDEGRVVGMALSLLGRADDGAGEVIAGLRHLTGVAVQPDWQGRGVGTQLVNAAIDHAQRAGCERVTLWADSANERAQGFFTARGFHTTGRMSADERGATMLHLEAALMSLPGG